MTTAGRFAGAVLCCSQMMQPGTRDRGHGATLPKCLPCHACRSAFRMCPLARLQLAAHHAVPALCRFAHIEKLNHQQGQLAQRRDELAQRLGGAQQALQGAQQEQQRVQEVRERAAGPGRHQLTPPAQLLGVMCIKPGSSGINTLPLRCSCWPARRRAWAWKGACPAAYAPLRRRWRQPGVQPRQPPGLRRPRLWRHAMACQTRRAPQPLTACCSQVCPAGGRHDHVGGAGAVVAGAPQPLLACGSSASLASCACCPAAGDPGLVGVFAQLATVDEGHLSAVLAANYRGMLTTVVVADSAARQRLSALLAQKKLAPPDFLPATMLVAAAAKAGDSPGFAGASERAHALQRAACSGADPPLALPLPHTKAIGRLREKGEWLTVKGWPDRNNNPLVNAALCQRLPLSATQLLRAPSR